MSDWDEGPPTSAAQEPLVPKLAARPPATFRFTIGGMLVLTFAAAVLVAGLFALPAVFSAALAGLMSFCIPAALVGCIIYGGPAWRAFAIGTLLPSGLRLVRSLFGGSLVGAGVSGVAFAQQQMLQQSFLRQGRGVAFSTDQSSAFDHFTRLAEVWDKLGYAYMAEETLFWGASGLAGLATLFVQRSFARAAPRAAA